MNKINSPDDITIKELVGASAYSRVFRGVIKSSGKEVAIKLIDIERAPFSAQHIGMLLKSWETIMDNNIEHVYGHFVNHSIYWIVTDYVNSGSLREILMYGYKEGLKDEILIASIILGILSGLSHLHSVSRIHKDLKSSNILFSQKGHVIISDFGFSTPLSSECDRQTLSKSNQSCFYAPEILRNESDFSEKSDIWCLGIIAIEMTTGKIPFVGVNIADLVDISQYIPKFTQFSPAFQDFINTCLNINPSKRLSTVDLIKSKFIKQAQNSDYIQKRFLANLPALPQIFSRLHNDIKPEFEFQPQIQKQQSGRFTVTRSQQTSPSITAGESSSAIDRLALGITEMKQKIEKLEKENEELHSLFDQIMAAVRNVSI